MKKDPKDKLITDFLAEIERLRKENTQLKEAEDLNKFIDSELRQKIENRQERIKQQAAEIERLKASEGLIRVQAEYIKLLEAAYSETFSIAATRSYYKPNEQHVKKGIELREKIKSLSPPFIKEEEEKKEEQYCECGNKVRNGGLCGECCPE